MKIMIVDDSITMRRIEVLALKKAGYTDVMEAENGADAFDKLATTPVLPEVILLDWNMPGMSGIEVLRKIKADRALKKIAVIMVTTEAEKERVLEALKSGASGYLVKPLTPRKFMSQVIEKLGK